MLESGLLESLQELGAGGMWRDGCDFGCMIVDLVSASIYGYSMGFEVKMSTYQLNLGWKRVKLLLLIRGHDFLYAGVQHLSLQL